MTLAGGFAAVGYEYDKSNNMTRQSYYSKTGDLTWCQYGYSEITYTYDNRNHCVEEHLLNAQGQPAVHTSGLYSWLSRDVDPDGRVLSVKYFGISGEPVSYANQYAEIRYTYDLAGRETSIAYYDRAGNMTLCNRGYAKKTTAYNQLGNVTEEAFYDVEENLVDTTMGYAIAKYEYDDLGNLTAERYLDSKSMGVEQLDARYAFALMEYDDEGRLTGEDYYDPMGNPVNCREGYASHHISYTDSDLIAEESYVDATGTPVAHTEGKGDATGELTYSFTSRELISEDEASGTYEMRVVNEDPTAEAEGAYSVLTYDRYDRVIVSRYFDANDAPVEGVEGCAMVTREYTSRGQISMIRYFDGEGNGTLVNGVYGLKREYNAYANLEMETWLDAAGNPALNDDGYAAIQYDYDLSNSTTEQRYYQYYLDENGEPVAANNNAWGVYTLYYPVTKVHRITYIDQNEEPITITDGYAILEYEDDENGNRVWEGYFDEIHAQINCAEGYSSVERGYDNEGRLISERYLDRYNKLINNAEGVAGWNGYYDEDGNLIVTSRYDQDRNPLPADEEVEEEAMVDAA